MLCVEGTDCCAMAGLGDDGLPTSVLTKSTIFSIAADPRVLRLQDGDDILNWQNVTGDLENLASSDNYKYGANCGLRLFSKTTA